MHIQINGEAKELNAGTVAELMQALDLSARKVAIELNLAIVPRSLYSETALNDGDRIEIVQFIGGG